MIYLCMIIIIYIYICIFYKECIFLQVIALNTLMLASCQVTFPVFKMCMYVRNEKRVPLFVLGISLCDLTLLKGLMI
jgi:hypothetical protein